VRYVIDRIRKDVSPSRLLKLPLKLLLVRALPATVCLYLDPDILAIHHAHDVRAADRPEPVEMLVRVNESAAVVAVVKDVLPRQPFEDRLLRCAFLHSLRRLDLSNRSWHSQSQG
jgi:hypothetical protein